MRFAVTAEEINRSKVLTPGWYVCRLKAVTDKTSKSSNAEMSQFDFVVTDNPGNPPCPDKSSSANVPLKPVYVSEAGIGFYLNLLSVLLGRKVQAGDEFDSSTFPQTVGKELKIFVKNEEYQGKVGNVAADYAVL